MDSRQLAQVLPGRMDLLEEELDSVSVSLLLEILANVCTASSEHMRMYMYTSTDTSLLDSIGNSTFMTRTLRSAFLTYNHFYQGNDCYLIIGYKCFTNSPNNGIIKVQRSI